MRLSVAQRIIKNTQVGSDDECWPWIGSINMFGYGRIKIGGREGRVLKAHRISYEQFIGPIPKGFVIDHLCHGADLECEGGSDCLHRRCVNPSHLEAVSISENTLRGNMGWWKTGKCRNGLHDVTNPDSWYIFDDPRRPSGKSRRCKECFKSASQKGYRAQLMSELKN